MDFQNESRQRQPLLSDSNDEIDIPDDGHELLATKDEMITIREKMLSVACFFLLVGMCMFAYLYEKRGVGHHHGGAMDMSTLEQSVCTDDHCINTAAYMIQSMNATANPCEDFYSYVCRNEINTRQFSNDYHVLEYINRNILDPLARKSSMSNEENEQFKKMDLFYESCIHRNITNLTGLHSVLYRLDSIFNTTNHDRQRTKLSEALGYLATNAIFPFFQLQVLQNIQNASNYSLNILQAGLTLPSSLDYQSNNSVNSFRQNVEKTLKILSAYGVHVDQGIDMYELAGQIVDMESRLASINESPEQLYTSLAFSSLHSLDDLNSLVPSMDWKIYFDLAMNIVPEYFNIRTPEYFQKLDEILQAENTTVIHKYLVWHVLLAYANEMPTEARYAVRDINENLAYEETNLCERKTTSVFGSIIGVYFPTVDQEQNELVQQMFLDIKRIFAKSLPRLGWMDRFTAGHAIRKLEAMTVEVGNPYLQSQPNASWHADYQDLQISNDYMANAMSARRWEYMTKLMLLRRSIDNNIWPILPLDTLVYYEPITNKMYIPTGAVFSDPASEPEYLMYSRVGSQLAKEMIKACDQVGSQFDYKGEMVSWWSKVTKDAYSARQYCIESETHKPSLAWVPREHAGMQIAHKAWSQRLKDGSITRIQDMPGTLGSLGPEKLFYIANGLLQCHKPQARLNEALAYDRAFIRIYECKPSKQCTPVWA